MKWFELAKSRMKGLDVNQEKLAEHLGITKGAVSHWLNDRRKPSIEEIAQIMRYLGLKEFTVNGDGTISSPSTDENVRFVRSYIEKEKYPLISWVSAGAWAEAVEPYTLDEVSEWYDADTHVEGPAFWLRVTGDSMTAPYGVSIPDGMLILVDTGREAKNGSLVVAKLTEANEATFKKLIIDAGVGKRYLQPLNPNQQRIEIDGNCAIIGVAVEQRGSLV